MSILNYFKRKEEVLPDPRGELSSVLPPRAIALAKLEIKKSTDASKRPTKRGSYHCYSPEQRAAIGKYACTNGVTATSRYFTRKLGHQVNTSTILSIKKAYLSEKNSRDKEVGTSVEVPRLPCKPKRQTNIVGNSR